MNFSADRELRFLITKNDRNDRNDYNDKTDRN